MQTIFLLCLWFIFDVCSSPLYIESPDGFKLYTVTYATHVNRKDFCNVMKSAWGWGFQVNVIGQRRSRQYEKYHLVDKVFALRKFIRKLPKRNSGKNVIMFMDAYDVLVNASPFDLLQRFLDTDKKVLFASEKGCCSTKWYMMNRMNTCDSKWPIDVRNHTSPWINTGVFIGYQNELRVLLDAAWIEYHQTLKEIQPGQVDPYVSGSDQQLIGQLFSYHKELRERISMGIDVMSEVFQCMYKVAYIDSIDLLFHENRVAFKGSAYTYPVMVHFNGPKQIKQAMMEYFFARVVLPKIHNNSAIRNITYLETCFN